MLFVVGGILPIILLKAGSLSKLVFEDPIARVRASRSSGEGAKARIDSVDKIESEPVEGGARNVGRLVDDAVDP